MYQSAPAMYTTGSPDMTQPQREPAVPSALGELAHAASAVEDRVALLAERLRGVRRTVPRPEAVARPDESDEPGAAPLACELRGQAARLQRVERMVSALLSDLEL